MYVQPDGVTDELLEAMAEHADVCHYLDMPLQHASASVLRAHAARRATRSLPARSSARIRDALPDVVLRTTLIAGFPGETASDVGELERLPRGGALRLRGRVRLLAEDGTPAATMPDLSADDDALERARSGCATSPTRIGFERAAARVGDDARGARRGHEEDGVRVGRWRGQAPEVDGRAYSLDSAATARRDRARADRRLARLRPRGGGVSDRRCSCGT